MWKLGRFVRNCQALTQTPYKLPYINGIPVALQTILAKTKWFGLSKAVKNERKITVFDW